MDSLFKSMTIKERIAQLFFVDVPLNQDGERVNAKLNEIEKWQPGGILFMGGTLEQLNYYKTEIDHRLQVPPLYSIDGEWGMNMRIDSMVWFPKHMMLGAIRDNRVVKKVGRAVGEECAANGIQINFAPVLDVNNNAGNPVINIRSFGENPNRVAEKGYAFFSGMQSVGVMAVGKHFPGHGDTHLDSHVDLPKIDKTLKELNQTEIIPFRKASQLGIQGIMTAHLMVDSLTKDELPVSLSPNAISYLKDTIGFNGLIFSDALNMGAVDQRIGQHYLKAYLAGNDILLFPADINDGIEQIYKGLMDSLISEDELNIRVKKILILKQKLLGISGSNISSDYLKSVQRLAIENSLTLLKNKDRLLPLSTRKDIKSGILSINSEVGSFSKIMNRYKTFVSINLKSDNVDGLHKELLKTTELDEIVVAISGNSFAISDNYGLNNKAIEILRMLPRGKKIVLTFFSNPYALNKLPDDILSQIDAVLVAYENRPEIQEVAAQMLMGGLPVMGSLPVSVKNFPEGTGLFTNKTRLSYNTNLSGKPFNKDTIVLIDSIAHHAIDIKATPGCQVMVVHKGEVILDKCYGYHTYSNKIPVKPGDLYDLASVTKVTATVPIVMCLNEGEILSLDRKLKTFNSICTNPFKSDVTIRELLLHQSGLKPYIPFHYLMLDTENLPDGLFNRRKSGTFSIKVDEGIYANRKVKFRKGFMASKYSNDFSIEVAPKFYTPGFINDSISAWIDSSEVDSSKRYHYCDLNFSYLEKVIEDLTHKKLDRLSDSLFFNPLGMSHTVFKPLNYFTKDEIVPTEDDRLFRKQLIHGYVHDQAAAIVGGVSGHAGLFSNANDLAKFGQMLLNNGWYGDKPYFDWSTIDYYTQTGNLLNRRGLGFDKPEPDTSKVSPACASASLQSYGHSGFTGTYFWIDPKYDLIYIFLSNRIHPDAFNRKLIEENVRTNIQQKIYNALLTSKSN